MRHWTICCDTRSLSRVYSSHILVYRLCCLHCTNYPQLPPPSPPQQLASTHTQSHTHISVHICVFTFISTYKYVGVIVWRQGDSQLWRHILKIAGTEERWWWGGGSRVSITGSLCICKERVRTSSQAQWLLQHSGLWVWSVRQQGVEEEEGHDVDVVQEVGFQHLYREFFQSPTSQSCIRQIITPWFWLVVSFIIVTEYVLFSFPFRGRSAAAITIPLVSKGV